MKITDTRIISVSLGARHGNPQRHACLYPQRLEPLWHSHRRWHQLASAGPGGPQTPGMAKVAQGLLEHFKPLAPRPRPLQLPPHLGSALGAKTHWPTRHSPPASSAASISPSGTSWARRPASRSTSFSVASVIAFPAYVAGGYYEEGKGLSRLGGRDGREPRPRRQSGQDEDRRRAPSKTMSSASASPVRPSATNIKLMVDANCAYSVRDAIKVANAR